MKPFTSIRHIAAISVAAISLLLTAGCSGEENEPGGNASNAAIITASVGKADNVASTRASETAWDVGDCIGISTSSTSTKGKTNYINIRYQTNGSVFSPVPGAAGEDNTIYFQGTSPMEFTAYYPCQGANGTRPGNNGVITRTLTAADQSTANLPDIDYLWAQKTAQSSNPKVDFLFSHRMSRLVLNFKAGAGVSLPPDGLAYTLTGLVQEGAFDTSTGEAKATGSTPADLTGLPTTPTTTTTATGQATGTTILWPQAANSVRLQLTLNGITFGAVLTFPSGTAAGEALAPSTSYTFNVTVERTGLEIGNADIDGWTDDGGSKDITLHEYRTLTYNANGGTGTVNSSQVLESSTTTLNDGTGLTHPDGKIFAGWNTLPEGGGEFYDAGGTLTMPAGNLTLYALWSGDGSTKEKPVLITDVQGMKDVGTSSKKKHYRLCKDLVLDDWEAIHHDNGFFNDPFSGTFDGGGHTLTLNGVKGIRTTFQGSSGTISGYFFSLFAYIESGEVRRLRVDGQITVNGTDESADYYVGGIYGHNFLGTVTDCISDVTVTATGKMSTLYAGGIAGYNISGKIFNCYATGEIESTATAKDVNLGGIAGYNGFHIANCAALNSNISGEDRQNTTYIHRITGYSTGTIVNNYASATLTAFGDKGLDKLDGEDCDAKPAASWWTGQGRWADSFQRPGGYTDIFTPWDFTTTWEVTDGHLPVLHRK